MFLYFVLLGFLISIIFSKKVQRIQKSLSNPILIQHIRKNDRTPIGTLIAVKRNDGIVKLGWSLCNRKLDTFSKKNGILEAKKKLSVSTPIDKLPWIIRKKVLTEFSFRCLAYFKLNSVNDIIF